MKNNCHHCCQLGSGVGVIIVGVGVGGGKIIATSSGRAKLSLLRIVFSNS